MIASCIVSADIVLIPDTLLAVKSAYDLEMWEATWEPTSTASMLDELKAHHDLYVERFVRRNVSRAKFREWLEENPRTFTTNREQRYLKAVAACRE